MTDKRAPFTREEMQLIERSDKARELMLNAPAATTVGDLRAAVRDVISPPSIGDRLMAVADACPVPFGPVSINAIRDAAHALDHADLVMKLRPISELRQEAYAKFGRRHHSDPYRQVVFWRESGYVGSYLEGRTGRIAAPETKFAGQPIGVDGEPLTDSGTMPIYFSELPLGALSQEK